MSPWIEGVIDITKTGIISRATFGIHLVFGYHEAGGLLKSTTGPAV
jgi:hypothetical protein